MNSVTSYKGYSVIDSGAFYCPYIPLQVIGVKPRVPKISQTGLIFEFELDCFPAAYEWLKTECVWQYDVVFLGTVVPVVKVTFFDPKGAVEFKLRFCE